MQRQTFCKDAWSVQNCPLTCDSCVEETTAVPTTEATEDTPTTPEAAIPTAHHTSSAPTPVPTNKPSALGETYAPSTSPTSSAPTPAVTPGVIDGLVTTGTNATPDVDVTTTEPAVTSAEPTSAPTGSPTRERTPLEIKIDEVQDYKSKCSQMKLAAGTGDCSNEKLDKLETELAEMKADADTSTGGGGDTDEVPEEDDKASNTTGIIIVVVVLVVVLSIAVAFVVMKGGSGGSAHNPMPATVKNPSYQGARPANQAAAPANAPSLKVTSGTTPPVNDWDC